ncbi:TIGR03086 family metal-binding protein [Streptomyces sp. WMMC500]|uniref:TIGR03086 family metal-binding protein n=1 Tax=Streptomyces sp. WMMC500 TaxID=3015154 RepID=UPI00248C0ABC|nr:TIGR03086 family metal-binding protein [Streptomyces sp. WMMC500]WBB60299.1 TIGR03086 family metal-binding protein [Streptomyces sp. WMMC500]
MTNASPDVPAAHPDLGPQTAVVARLAAGVPEDRLEDPTPCEGMAVRHLLGHLVGLTAAFRDAGRKDLGPTTGTDPSSAPRPDIGPGWREELARQLPELAQAWHDPAAWEGDTQAGGVTFPAAEAGRVALNELVLHGWDLARATGRRYEPDEEALRVSYELGLATPDGPAREGMFGPIVAVPQDAPLLDQVVGLSGRDPGWTPPGH